MGTLPSGCVRDVRGGRAGASAEACTDTVVVVATDTDARSRAVEAGAAGPHRAVASDASDGARGQLVGSAGCRVGETGCAGAGAVHDLPTVALDNATRCPQMLGQPAPEATTQAASVPRARVAHTAHSPYRYWFGFSSETRVGGGRKLSWTETSRASAKRGKTGIEWTEATWNPVTGCSKVSPGCKHCYAERMAGRLRAMGAEAYRNGFELTLQPEKLELPLQWRWPQTIFVNSMSDLFHEDVPTDYVRRVFDVMQRASWHRFQVLTKRAERLVALDAELVWAPNIWMGVSVETAAYVWRIDCLRQTRARVRFLSLEPLLEPLEGLDLSGIHWVIVGGESGPGARPMKASWARSVRDQCLRAGVPFFFKQWGGVNKKRAGRLLDGRTWGEMPRTSVTGDDLRDPLGELECVTPLTDAPPQARRVEPLDVLPQERSVDEDRFAEREALVDLVACTARGSGFDEDHAAGDLRHEPVAFGEVPLGHGSAGLKGGNHEMLNRDSLLEAGVMTGVGLVEGGAEHGDGATTLTHRGFVGGLVDPCGETRENDDAATYELRGGFGCECPALVGSAAGAHDGDAWAVEEADVSGRVDGAPAREGDGGANDPRIDSVTRSEG
jgi:protein gp37